MADVLRRVLLVVVCALALAACRLDVEVTLELDPDGTGAVTVVAEADAGLVSQVPDLADHLVFDDAVEAGWEVTGPEQVDGGGLRVTLRHEVRSAQELANVMNSIGPPFDDVRAGRETVDEQTTNEIRGTLVLRDGFASFADAELIDAVGGMPFGELFEAAGATPAESMSVIFRASMPGEVITATGVEVEPDVIEWAAPLDGSSVEIVFATVQRPASGGSWARPLATLTLVALVVWVVLSVVVITLVVVARRRRSRRRRRRSRPPVGHRPAP